MYNSLIDNLKKILESKDTADKKLLKIQTLVDFAAGLEKQPQWPTMPNYRDRVPGAPYQTEPFLNDVPKPTVKKPAGPGAIVGVEDIK
jgi:hypothetical protein